MTHGTKASKVPNTVVKWLTQAGKITAKLSVVVGAVLEFFVFVDTIDAGVIDPPDGYVYGQNWELVRVEPAQSTGYSSSHLLTYDRVCAF